ncbi:hypothetical protein [Cellulosimicrobium protaetiae]
MRTDDRSLIEHGGPVPLPPTRTTRPAVGGAPYTPRHRADSEPTGRQSAREEVAAMRLRNGQPGFARGRHGVYSRPGVTRVPFTFSHPDDRLPLGLSATTGQEAA